MTWLFVYAHPDDETVAAGGTIKLLTQMGETVKVVLATAGQLGKVAPKLRPKLKQHGSVEALRRQELQKAMGILGVNDHQILEFTDGAITNETVWGPLQSAFIELLDTHRPQAIVTFDHSGWYYHLDHVGVSIALTRAIKHCQNSPDLILLNPFHPPGLKDHWPYFYQPLNPTHRVDITPVIPDKIRALKAHASQAIPLITPLKEGKMNYEYFRLAKATKKGQKYLKNSIIFSPLSS